MEENIFELDSEILKGLYPPDTKIGLKLIENNDYVQFINLDTGLPICGHKSKKGKAAAHLQKKGKSHVCKKCEKQSGEKATFFDLRTDTMNNRAFRESKFSTERCQLIMQSLSVNEAINCEIHPYSDQIFYFEKGHGTILASDKSIDVKPGFCVCIPAGVCHKVINTSNHSLKFFVFYSPPMHPGEVHQGTQKVNISDLEQAVSPISGGLEYRGLSTSYIDETENEPTRVKLITRLFTMSRPRDGVAIFAPIDCKVYRVNAKRLSNSTGNVVPNGLVFYLGNNILLSLYLVRPNNSFDAKWEDIEWKFETPFPHWERSSLNSFLETKNSPLYVVDRLASSAEEVTQCAYVKSEEKIVTFPGGTDLVFEIKHPETTRLNSIFDGTRIKLEAGKTKIFS